MDFSKKEARERVVTFRLTNGEYERLRSVCEQSATSVSDAARSAVLALVPSACGSFEIKLDNFDGKLDQIITLLHTLNHNPSSL